MIKLINNDIIKINSNELDQINLVITSPPYNIGIKYDQHIDTMTYEDYLVWCKQWLTKMFYILADDGRICINVPFTVSPKHLNKIEGEDDINYPVAADYIKICQSIGFQYWRTLVWEKMISNSSTTWGSWRSASCPFMRDPSEAILIFSKKYWKRKTEGASTMTGEEFMTYTKNVWMINPETQSDHPAAFPLELPSRCIKLLSYKNDVVCDCFMGSGTTGEAAMRLGRSFVGIEISTDYFTKAKERIESAELQTSLIQQFMPAPNDLDNTIEAW